MAKSTKSEELIKDFIYEHLDELADIIKEVVKERDTVSKPVKGDLFKLRGEDYMVVDVDSRIKNERTGEEIYGLCIGAVKVERRKK